MTPVGTWIPVTLLVVALLACGSEQAPPAATQVAPGSGFSEAGHYHLRLRPQDGEVPLGRLHSWLVTVETADGEPFEPQRLAVSGGMPQHAHGFQSEPRVTQALGNGEFLIEGVSFHMQGDWTLRLELVGPAGPDVAIFHVHVTPDAAGNGFGPGEIAILRSLSLDALPEPPASASNGKAADPRAARLGHRLFFDPKLSAGGKVSCVTCHDPAQHFTDGRATALGLAPGSRNTPSVVGAAYAPWQFWDGRRDSLWAQALAPMETSHEMGSTRLEIARLVTRDPRYRSEYEEIFGATPDFSDTSRFPERAGPFGDDEARAAWARLSPEAKQQVNRAFANTGKAIGAYERLLLPGRSRFDRYVAKIAAGNEAAAAEQLSDDEEPSADEELSADELSGLRLFLDGERTLCLRCHNGPLFTNQGFHDIGSSRGGTTPDLGRYLGIQSVLLDEFNCLGPHSDASPDACEQLRFLDRREIARLSGAFKTPTLRDAAQTAPYFHDGSLGTLEDVIAHYRNPPEDPGSELKPLELSDQEAAALASFLRTLSGGVATDPEWLAPPAASVPPDSGPTRSGN